MHFKIQRTLLILTNKKFNNMHVYTVVRFESTFTAWFVDLNKLTVKILFLATISS
ncbi:hypothetical protein DAI22_03g087200 [Oryza sativa Japonica Group]|nr:hypothetical protein DAI22_03g087200 [Oryza sativa Japonica Group]